MGAIWKAQNDLNGPQVQLTEEELAAIIKETQSKLEDLEVEDNDEDDEDGAKENAEAGDNGKEDQPEEEEEEDVIKKYGLDTYDEDGDFFHLWL